METCAIPVILAGGGGTRLWPLSGKDRPKQFLPLLGKDTLFQATINRLKGFCNLDGLKVVCGKQHEGPILEELSRAGLSGRDHLVMEPCARNTGPAVLLAIKTLMKEGDLKDPILMVMPVDHMITHVDSFHRCMRFAVEAANTGAIATLGIIPDQPETGYGYIEAYKTETWQTALPVLRFVEKPDLKTAQHYVSSGRFFWNAGIFVFRASAMLEEFQRFQPHMCQRIDAFLAGDPTAYETANKLSIDYAVMEHTQKTVAVPANMGWSDLGNWSAVHQLSNQDAQGNASRGNVHLEECRNCFFHGTGKPVVGLGVENLIVVDAPGALLVAHETRSQMVGKLAEKLGMEHQAASLDCPDAHHFGDDCLIRRHQIPSGQHLTHQPKAPGSWTVIKGQAIMKEHGTETVLNKGMCYAPSGKGDLEIHNRGETLLLLVEIKIPGLK